MPTFAIQTTTMKKLVFLTILAFTSITAYAQQPSNATIEAAKHDKLMNMLAAKSNGNGSNQTASFPEEQDCINAITVCQPVYYQENSYTGSGNITNEITPGLSCLGAGELNAVWYRVVAAGQGYLGFNISPNNNTDDYDWAVFDLTYYQCSEVATLPQLQISCNFSGSTFPNAVTGPNGDINVQDEPLIEVVPGHIYYICVSNFSSTQSGYTLDFAPSTIPIGNCAFIYGNVYYDNDQDCQRNGNDLGLPNQIIYATPGPYYSVTGPDGFYTLAVPQTQNVTYYISSIPSNGELDLTCPSPLNYREVTITNVDSVYTGNDFGYFGNDNGSTPCPVIHVSNVSPIHLVCCPGNRYIQICNTGSGPYENGQLQLNYYDDFIEPISASIPYTTNNNTITFALPTIGIGECYNVVVAEQVTDPIYLNQTACVEATITPYVSCFSPNSLWDGSNLITNGTCLVDSVQFTITNIGAGDMAQPETYEVYLETALVDDGTFTLQAGQSQVLTYPATGGLYIIQVNQSDYNPNITNPATFVGQCGPEMPPSDAYNLFGQGDEPDYIDTDCNNILNSYDPNDKSAVPAGVGPQHFVSAYDVIEYKIRFQNLGNAPAYKVVIKDTLDANLDPSTLHLGASSHHYTAQLTGNGILTFTFDDIQLPAASVDEAGSIGVVSYSIKQLWGLPINYSFENTAYIYFDTNPAIITNTVFHNVKDNTTAISESSKGNIVATIYPNPASNSFVMKLNALKAGQSYTMQLFTGTGALVHEVGNIKTVENTVDVSTLVSGLYYYRVLTTDGKTAAGRFVKE